MRTIFTEALVIDKFLAYHVVMKRNFYKRSIGCTFLLAFLVTNCQHDASVKVDETTKLADLPATRSATTSVAASTTDSAAPSHPAVVPSPVGINEGRDQSVSANAALLKDKPGNEKDKLKLPDTLVTVTQFFFTNGVNEDQSPKEILKEAVFPEHNPILQFSVLLRGTVWPKCFFINLYREDKSLGSVHHCHTPLIKELETGVAYIATKPVTPERLRPSDKYRAELYADDRILGTYPFKVVTGSLRKPTEEKARTP